MCGLASVCCLAVPVPATSPPVITALKWMVSTTASRVGRRPSVARMFKGVWCCVPVRSVAVTAAV